MVVTCSHVQASAHIHMSHPHMIHYPHPIIGPTDAGPGDRDRPVVAPRARTRTPDARLVHKTYMKPNAECTHGQYSFYSNKSRPTRRPLQDRQLYRGAIALNSLSTPLRGSTFAGVAAEEDETNILR
jgi:hypothetical protein